MSTAEGCNCHSALSIRASNMVKIVKLEPIAEEAVVQTNANILSALL